VVKKYVVRLILETTSPLHIGTGAGESETLVEILRVNGRPLIPASSLKGALRALAERIAKSSLDYLDKDEREAVERHRDDPLRGVIHLTREEVENLLSQGDEGIERMKELETRYAKLCPIDRIFGCTSYASALKLTDCLAIQYTLDTLPGVGIDRETLRFKEGMLSFTQVVGGRANFAAYMIIDIERLSRTARKLLASILTVLAEQGIQVGARKSVGLGLIKVVREKCKAYLVDGVELLAKPKEESLEELMTKLRA